MEKKSETDNRVAEERRSGAAVDAMVITRSSETMPEVETGSVGLVFESIPYERMVRCCGQPECLATHAAGEFVEQFAKFLPERLRVLADDGNYVLNFQPQVIDGFESPAGYLLPQAIVAAGFKLVQAHVWAKGNAMPFAPERRLKASFEYCWHFAKSERYFFDKDAVRVPSEWATKDKRTERYNSLGKDPGTVFFAAKATDQARLGHPAKMADGVATRFVNLLCPPGGLVADGFAGTGQTGVEALALGRRFVGYELHEERADQARARLGVKEDVIMNKTWMTPKEAAEYTGLALATIYTKTHHGKIPVHKGSGAPRYHKGEIDAWMRGEWKPEANKTAQSAAKEG